MPMAENIGPLKEYDSDACFKALFYLEPKNDSAVAVIHNNPHRVVELTTAADVRIKALKIQVEEPNQRRGLLVFGRHPSCGVKFKDPKVGSEYCFVDINPSSGELLLCDSSRHHSTILDNEAVRNPPSRAMVYQHARYFRISSAVFEIHWPCIPGERLQEYFRMKIAAARRLREDADRLFDLTDLEWDLNSTPSTEISTRPPTREATPSPDQPSGRGPIQISKLGQGSFGIVYKAVDRISANFVAVKEFNVNIFSNAKVNSKAQVMETFEREISIMRDLKHENVVRLLEWRKFEGKIQLQLEYCSAGNLETHRSEQIDILDMFRQVAAGLHYLHVDAEIIHRDVKPENILVNDSGCGERSFKLADFGLSNAIAKAQTFCGTVHYMAPEVYLGETQTTKLDIYALGVVILQQLGAFNHWVLPRHPGRRGYCDIIIQKAAEFRSGVPGVDFARTMIAVNSNQRPTAGQCIEFCQVGEDPRRKPGHRDPSPVAAPVTSKTQLPAEINQQEQRISLARQPQLPAKIVARVERQRTGLCPKKHNRKRQELPALSQSSWLQKGPALDQPLKNRQQSPPSDRTPRPNWPRDKMTYGEDEVVELQYYLTKGAVKLGQTRRHNSLSLERRTAVPRLKPATVQRPTPSVKEKIPSCLRSRLPLSGDKIVKRRKRERNVPEIKSPMPGAWPQEP